MVSDFWLRLTNRGYMQRNIKKYQAIIFDIDGTLCDSVGLCTMAWNNALKSLGSDSKINVVDFKANLGKPIGEIIENIVPDPYKKRADVVDLLNVAEIEAIEENGWFLYPGVIEALEQLSDNYSIALISNCQPDYLNKFVELSGLRKFIADRDCHGLNGVSKGEMIKNMMVNNDWNHILYVGDTSMDYEACREAGCDFIYASYGYGSVEGKVRRIESIKDLSGVI